MPTPLYRSVLFDLDLGICVIFGPTQVNKYPFTSQIAATESTPFYRPVTGVGLSVDVDWMDARENEEPVEVTVGIVGVADVVGLGWWKGSH